MYSWNKLADWLCELIGFCLPCLCSWNKLADWLCELIGFRLPFMCSWNKLADWMCKMNGFRLPLCAVGISCLIGCVNLSAFGFLVCAIE